ncbi:MAG: hypothetical protein HY735_02985, partial [Verrucomicrobia bacterium]|nr:hypothetical protein [Verrucomicrobiota bacterium]
MKQGTLPGPRGLGLLLAESPARHRSNKVYGLRNLQKAFGAVWSNKGSPGVDRQTVEQFAAQQTPELEKLSQQLQARTCRPHPVRRVWINKLGSQEKRPLG